MQKSASGIHFYKDRQTSGQSFQIIRPGQNSVAIPGFLFLCIRDPVLDAHRVSLYGCKRGAQIMRDPAQYYPPLMLILFLPGLRFLKLPAHAVKFFEYLSKFIPLVV